MEILSILIFNKIIFASVLAWAVAQTLKLLINYFKYKRLNLERLVGTGGMPSAHSAFVSAAAVAVIRTCGIESTEFGLIFVVAIITMYDAMTLRFQSGMHAKKLNELHKKLFEKENSKSLNELIGHTFWEVLCGFIIGILIALVVPFNL